MTPAANLPPMSLTPVVTLIPVVYLEFWKKFELTLISVAWGKMIHKKNEAKIA